jgi:quinol monooxygenase YgiN
MRDRGDLLPAADPDSLAPALLAAMQGGMLLTQTLRDTAPPRGNLAFDSYGKTGDRRSYVLLERYASREALDAHRQAPHFTGRLLAQIVPLLESRTVEEYDVPG